MASNYPGSLDSFDTIASDKKTSDAVGGRTHRAMHNDLGDAIEAIETELGTTPSGSYDTVKARFEAIEANDWVTSARIAANAVGSSELADNAVDTAAIQDSAVTSAKIADGTIVSSDVAESTFVDFATVGNLLAATESDGTFQTGAEAWQTAGNCTVTVAGWGPNGAAHSLRMTSAAGGNMSALLPLACAVAPGKTYTMVAKFAGATAGRTVQVFWQWLDAANGWLANTDLSSPVTDRTDGVWVQPALTATAPANAAKVSLYVRVLATGGASEVHDVGDIGFWEGCGGQWTLPGVPVPGQSRIAVNNAVDLSGTGSPEGVVTAAPGSTWLQTDATTDVKGWIRWVKASGTGNTGWIAGPEADTGTRNLNGVTWLNGWAAWGANGQRIRRVGSVVDVHLELNKASSSADTCYTLPSGFRPFGPWTAYFSAQTANSAVPAEIAIASGNIVVARGSLGGNVMYVRMTFITSDAWPSSLPGSAA